MAVILGLGAISMPFAPAAVAAPAGAVSCYGDYCSGQDPETSGCAQDAQTVEWLDLSGARLELRFSPRCQTEWAKWIQYPVGLKSDFPQEIDAVQDTGYTQKFSFTYVADDGETLVRDASPGTYWTAMIYSPHHEVKATVQLVCSGLGAGSVGEYITGCALESYEETPSY